MELDYVNELPGKPPRKNGSGLSTLDRFMSWVNKEGALILDTPCWEWTGSTFRHNYGHFVVQVKGVRKDWNAHRWLWEYENGPIPDGLKLCHRCDNSLCVRPSHMFVGTQKHNLDDMWAKNRQGDCRNFGAANAATKLTEQQKQEILARWGDRSLPGKGRRYGDLTFRSLANEYGVTPPTIHRLIALSLHE